MKERWKGLMSKLEGDGKEINYNCLNILIKRNGKLENQFYSGTGKN